MERSAPEIALEPSSLVEKESTPPGVLIVEDDERQRALLCQGLDEFGFRSWSAANGLEAIKLYPRLRHKVTAILLDIHMPGLDGRDTLNQFRSINPEARVYILTGHIDPAEEDELLAMGATRVFYKPVPLHYLAKTLHR